ncbi:MAG TPA: Gfo/Idh/MocA family oxidoreductase [Actinokineospora sp.]|jgi:predicted dehydrogenase|nr:Gfo/Idh/MocA family oxidoreductase [Actinokineospora sp.]
MRPIRVGVIGASLGKSWGAAAHLPALRALPGFELHAVATTRAESANATARAFNVPLACTNAFDLATHPAIDLVSVCVKVPHHDAIVRAALTAGKHVYCEWPLTVETEQAHDLARLAARSPGHHVVGLQGLASPSVEALRKLIGGGWVGRVLSATYTATVSGFGGQTINTSRLHTLDPRDGTTLLTVAGGHALSCLQHILGPLREVSARLDTRTPTPVVVETGAPVTATAPDQLAVVGAFRDGATVAISVLGGAAKGADTFELRIVCADATVVARPALAGLPPQIADWHIVVHEGADTRVIGQPECDDPVPAGAPRGVGRLYRRLAAAIREDGTVRPGFQDAAELHSVLDAVRRAARTGTRQGI